MKVTAPIWREGRARLRGVLCQPWLQGEHRRARAGGSQACLNLPVACFTQQGGTLTTLTLSAVRPRETSTSPWDSLPYVTKGTSQVWLRLWTWTWGDHAGLSGKVQSNTEPLKSRGLLDKRNEGEGETCKTPRTPMPGSFFSFLIYLAVPDVSCGTGDLHCSMWDPVPWPGIEPGPPALGAES